MSLGASELGALLSPTKAAAVEVIETICGYAAEAPRLPTPFRSLIARLRVPLLRLALRSETLLAAERHAALRMVDQIANLGRTVAPDCSPDLPVCRGLLTIVNTLAQAPRIVEVRPEVNVEVGDTNVHMPPTRAPRAPQEQPE